MADTAQADVTRDAFFGGRLTLRQPAKGHRAGTDAVLLSAAVPRDFSGHVYDVGAGVGTVGLGVALACPDARVTLIEKEPSSVALAADNIAANGLDARVAIVACDLLSNEERLARLPTAADLIVTNPPFYQPERVRASSDALRRDAHVFAPGDGLDVWLAACLACLDAKGTLIVINNAAAVPEMLSVLAPRLGDLTLMPVHPRVGELAVRVLLRGTKGRRGPFKIVAPLLLHDGAGFTARAADLHAGVAGLDW